MSFSIFDSKKYCGLNIANNGDYQLLKLVQKSDSFVPAYIKKGSLKTIFDDNDIFLKSEFVKIFRKYRDTMSVDEIKLSALWNPKLENEIIGALKIAGFKKVKVARFSNSLGIILDRKLSKESQVCVYFHNEEFNFYKISDGFVIDKKKVPFDKFNFALVEDFCKNTPHDKAYVFGELGSYGEVVKNIFSDAGIKAVSGNVWQNVLSFSEVIPQISPDDSHTLIKVLSFTVPDLKKWEEKIKIEKKTIKSKAELKKDVQVEKKEKTKIKKVKDTPPKTTNKKLPLSKETTIGEKAKKISDKRRVDKSKAKKKTAVNTVKKDLRREIEIGKKAKKISDKRRESVKVKINFKLKHFLNKSWVESHKSSKPTINNRKKMFLPKNKKVSLKKNTKKFLPKNKTKAPLKNTKKIKITYLEKIGNFLNKKL